MKKVLFLFITASCLFQVNGFSQKAQVGLNAGVSVTNIYGRLNNQNVRGDSRTGYTVGLVMEAPIGKTNISFRPGVHYVQKGKYTLKTESVREADALRYADILLDFIAYLNKSGNSRLFVGLGPQIGLNLPSKKIRVEDGERSELRSISFGETAADDYHGIDLGANGLIGVRLKCGATFAINYTFGLRNILPKEITKLQILNFPGSDEHLRNGALGFRFGYMFPNTPREKKKKEKK